ncbi:MAG: RNA polymerase sigma factor [Pseudomonadales bacterium]|nr:RNA polymerase sigma factor [Pseudomonadales bacterium]
MTVAEQGVPSDAPEEDAGLIKALQQGDEAAFAQLVKKYHRKLWYVARAIAGEIWAEEVLQDAWLSVYRSIGNFEGRSSLKTWLYTIVKNQAKTRLRKESRNSQSMENAGYAGIDESAAVIEPRFQDDGNWLKPPLSWDIDSPGALLEEEQLQQCINRAIDRLSPDQRAVFQMRDMQQMELGEICNILEFSSSNVRVLLHRARIALMQVIEKYQETGEC